MENVGKILRFHAGRSQVWMAAWISVVAGFRRQGYQDLIHGRFIRMSSSSSRLPSICRRIAAGTGVAIRRIDKTQNAWRPWLGPGAAHIGGWREVRS